jgi:hypothetical protein
VDVTTGEGAEESREMVSGKTSGEQKSERKESSVEGGLWERGVG